jgi:hypothetical protein
VLTMRLHPQLEAAAVSQAFHEIARLSRQMRT